MKSELKVLGLYAIFKHIFFSEFLSDLVKMIVEQTEIRYKQNILTSNVRCMHRIVIYIFFNWTHLSFIVFSFSYS